MIKILHTATWKNTDFGQDIPIYHWNPRTGKLACQRGISVWSVLGDSISPQMKRFDPRWLEKGTSKPIFGSCMCLGDNNFLSLLLKYYTKQMER